LLTREALWQLSFIGHILLSQERPTRKAEIKGFAEPVFYGVHGGIKDFYKIEPEKEHAATLDHIVGAIGG